MHTDAHAHDICADLQKDKHYPVEVLITGIISFVFIITMSLCIVLNNRKKKAFK